MNYDSLDDEKVNIKPYNSPVKVTNTSHALLPDFALKARLTGDSTVQKFENK